MEHQVTTTDLAGGAKLLVVNMPVAVSFSLDIYVRSGSRFAPLKFYELSHLLEHLSFEGNEDYPDAFAFKAEVERDGAYFNASTNSYYNVYRFVSLPHEVERIMKLGLSQVFKPILKPESIAHEKETATNELTGNLDNFQRLRSLIADQLILGKKLPSWEKRIKDLAGITADDLKQFHEAHYQPQNVRFVLSGNFSDAVIKNVINMINEALKDRKTGSVNPYEPFPVQAFERRVITRKIPPKNQALFSLQFVRPGIDLDAVAPLSIIQVMYSDTYTSRMMMKARQQGLTYTFGAGLATTIDQTFFEAYDQTESAKLKSLIELAITELADLVNGNFSDDELERAIGYEVGTMRRSYQTPANYGNWYGGDFNFDRPLISPEQRIKEVMAQSRKTIADAAKRYITKDNWALVVLGNKTEGLVDGIEQIIDKAFGN